MGDEGCGIAAADHSHRHLLCKCHYNCGDADLSQRHLLCKRQYNCGSTDLSQRHLLCKRKNNCRETYLSHRHLLCQHQYNCGNTDLSHRHLSCKRQYNGGDKPAAATAATIRAAATQICHTDTSSANANITAATSQPRPRRRLSAQQLLQEALRTASATQRRAAATAATIRAAAPSGSSAYCACKPRPRRRLSAPQLLQEALRTAPATQKRAAATRRLSAPQLLQEALRTVPAAQKRAVAMAATIRAAAPSGSSAYCACHTKASRGHSGDYPRRTPSGSCVLHLPHKSEPRPRRRLSAPQLLQEALRTAPATQKRAAATAATIRGAAPSGSSAYCTCHTKASRGHSGDYPRRSSFRKLCVLRLPHKSKPRPRRRLSAPQLLQETLRTAPATQKQAAATAATIRAAAPSGSSAYCTCHAKESRDKPRRRQQVAV